MPLANGSTGPSQRGTIVRILLALVVIAVVAVAGVYFVKHRDASANPPAPSAEAASPTPLPPPGQPACGEGDALLSAMSTRDKLAQLLMVGVTGADDARAVVANHHVGGIMIGSWTDLSMLPTIRSRRSPPPRARCRWRSASTRRAAGSSGCKGSSAASRRRGCWRRPTPPQEVHDIALKRGQAMRDLGITVDFAPVVDVTDQADDDRDRRPLVRRRSREGRPSTRAPTPGACAMRAPAGAQALPRPRARRRAIRTSAAW